MRLPLMSALGRCCR